MRKQCPNCLHAHEAPTDLCESCDHWAMLWELGTALALLVGGLALASLITAVLL